MDAFSIIYESIVCCIWTFYHYNWRTRYYFSIMGGELAKVLIKKLNYKKENE